MDWIELAQKKDRWRAVTFVESAITLVEFAVTFVESAVTFVESAVRCLEYSLNQYPQRLLSPINTFRNIVPLDVGSAFHNFVYIISRTLFVPLHVLATIGSRNSQLFSKPKVPKYRSCNRTDRHEKV
jgi:hypothetical protein